MPQPHIPGTGEFAPTVAIACLILPFHGQAATATGRRGQGCAISPQLSPQSPRALIPRPSALPVPKRARVSGCALAVGSYDH